MNMEFTVHKDDYEKLLKRAEETMAKHEYTCSARTDKLQAWRCQRPNDTIHGFDLVITKYGIAMFGDLIPPLTFRVGLDYGLPFLAGNSWRYMLSKLDGDLKKSYTEFDYDQAYDLVLERVVDCCFDLVLEHYDNKDVADYEKDLLVRLAAFSKEFREFRVHSKAQMIVLKGMLSRAVDLANGVLLLDDKYFGDMAADELESFIGEFHDRHEFESPFDVVNVLESIGVEVTDRNWDSPTEGAVFCLMAVHCAAKKILEQEEVAK